MPDRLGLFWVHDQLAVAQVVAERHGPSHPHALALAGGDLVADALASDLALELREGQQHVERQPAHAGGGVELLGDGHEGGAMAVQHLHDLGEVGEGSSEAIYLVDDDEVDKAGLDVGQQALQGGPF